METLKEAMRAGATVRMLEKALVKKYGTMNLTANTALLAARHIADHPELLEEGK